MNVTASVVIEATQISEPKERKEKKKSSSALSSSSSNNSTNLANSRESRKRKSGGEGMEGSNDGDNSSFYMHAHSVNAKKDSKNVSWHRYPDGIMGIRSQELVLKKNRWDAMMDKYAACVPTRSFDTQQKKEINCRDEVFDYITKSFSSMDGKDRHAGVPTSYMEVLAEVGSNGSVFQEIDPDSLPFGCELTKYFGSKTLVHAKTNVRIDRMYRVLYHGAAATEQDTAGGYGFYSNPNLRDFIAYARGDAGSTSKTSATTTTATTVTLYPSCHAALRMCSGLQYCLVVGFRGGCVRSGDVSAGPATATAAEVVTYGFNEASGEAEFCAARACTRPVLLVLFRKVRKSDLWITITNKDIIAEGVPKPIVATPLYLKDDETAAENMREFFDRLDEKGKEFRASMPLRVYMIPKTVCVTDKFICLSSRAPRESLDLIVAPRSPLQWDTLTHKDVGEIMGLYVFACYIRATLRGQGACLSNMEILFPADPSQWLVHCHVMACDEMAESTRSLLRIEEFVERLYNGSLTGGYRVCAETDFGRYISAPEIDHALSPADKKAALCDFYLSQNNDFFPQYWYGGSGDEPIVKQASK